LREAIEKLDPLGPTADRANTYRRLKEYHKAVVDYTILINTGGDTRGTVWYFYQRATPLWILGRREEALDDYREVRLQLAWQR
jgi:tetratricopeptide (TPR) repeat protein